MASWSGDGYISGFSTVTSEYTENNFVLASPGNVDVGGQTRLQYALPTAYKNRIIGKASITITNADVLAWPGRRFTAMLFVATDAALRAVSPTPNAIKPNDMRNLYATNPAAVKRNIGSTYAAAGSYNFVINGPKAETLIPNTKYWALVVPVAINPGQSGSWDQQVISGSWNTLGRGVSIWTNRTPRKPIITQPTSGITVGAGEVLTFSINDEDPDGFADSYASRDFAGYQIQYAPQPTVSNPAPEWLDLPFSNGDEDGTLAGWGIFGAVDPTAGGGSSLLTQFGTSFGVLAGANDLSRNLGILPAGQWQVRIRTFDFGHPYPVDFFYPLGDDSGSYTAHNYPETNTSPWSDPVFLAVSAQVPPPILISPLNSIALAEDNPVRLTWRYRNTHVPYYPQYKRTVQIRKAGDPDWSTVFAGIDSGSYVDLPPSLDNTVPGPTEYLTDQGFEGATVGGWSVAGAEYGGGTDGTETVSNVSAAAGPSGSHAGTRHLRLNYTSPAGAPGFLYTVSLLGDTHDTFQFDGWVGLTADTAAVTASLLWLDADGESIITDDTNTNAFLVGTGAAHWQALSLGPASRPGGAVEVVILIVGIGTGGTLNGLRVDDVSLQGSYTHTLDDFSFSATNEYEWRVQTTDIDGEMSNWSEVGRFWIVPVPASGEVRPPIGDTIDGATLGCGNNRVFVYRRGGKVRVGELTGIEQVDWGRVRDDISDAKVIIKDWDVDCGNLLSKLQTWAYEIVVIRENGFSSDRVWEGPITLLTYKKDSVTIQARDVMNYAYRRIIKQQMNDSGKGNGRTVVARAEQILQNVFAPDDPNLLSYLQPLHQPDDAMQYRSTPAYSRTAYEEIDDMAANSGLDYTCVGRAILLWGTKHRIGTLPEFKDADLGDVPIVSEYGMSFANRYAVSDGNGVFGEATRLDVSGNDENYGLVEMLSSSWASDSTEDSGTYTQEGLETVRESFKGYAEKSIADRFPPPVVVRIPDNTSLNPDTLISIQNLVPGVVVPLRSTGTLRQVVASQKLDSVRVTQTSKGETISITLSPFSRDDTNTEGVETE